MIQVLLRIAVWLVVIGLGYLLLGPQLFDSSRSPSPFENSKQLYLPPAKPQQLIEYEKTLKERSLDAAELEGYRVLLQERRSNFWRGDGTPVEEALAGIKKQRKQHLAAILAERGASQEEVAIFFTVAQRDHPSLFDDRE